MPINIGFTGEGVFPINSIAVLNASDDVLERRGQIWLRSGFIAPNPAIYPDADSTGGVGLPNPSTDTSSGLPHYIRVK